MKLCGRVAPLCLLAVWFAAAVALGQSRLERLPPVAAPPHNNRPAIAHRLADAPSADGAASNVSLAYASGYPRPPWFRARPPLWPDFAWGAAVPVVASPKWASSGISAEPNAWLRAEYLQFFMAAEPYAEPLVTASDAADQGLLGAPSTKVLFGGHAQPLGAFSGIRLTGGSWFNNQRTYGAEVSAFVLPTKTQGLLIAGDQSPGSVLALPFTSRHNGLSTPSSVVLGQQAATTGGVQIRTSTVLWGVEANGLRMIRQAPDVPGDLSFLAGVRFIQLGERFAMSSESTALGGLVNRDDHVHTQASFYGLQIGGRGVRRWGRLSLQGTAKVGFGATSNLVTLSGQNNTFSFGSPDPNASPANIQRNYLYDFSVVPELQARLAYDVRPGWRFSAGYDFLYWTRVLRPGNQLSTNVDATNQAAALAAPFSTLPADRHSNFWLHGWNIAIEWVR